MINARYEVERGTHSLTVFGHAGYAAKGSDIVCAGVSALVQALIGWLENNAHNVEYISVDEDGGEVLICCTHSEDIAAVFFMTAIGLEMISKEYPNHVHIDIIGIDD